MTEICFNRQRTCVLIGNTGRVCTASVKQSVAAVALNRTLDRITHSVDTVTHVTHLVEYVLHYS